MATLIWCKRRLRKATLVALLSTSGKIQHAESKIVKCNLTNQLIRSIYQSILWWCWCSLSSQLCEILQMVEAQMHLIKPVLYSWRIYCISEIYFVFQVNDLQNILFSNFVKTLQTVQCTRGMNNWQYNNNMISTLKREVVKPMLYFVNPSGLAVAVICQPCPQFSGRGSAWPASCCG